MSRTKLVILWIVSCVFRRLFPAYAIVVAENGVSDGWIGVNGATQNDRNAVAAALMEDHQLLVGNIGRPE